MTDFFLTVGIGLFGRTESKITLRLKPEGDSVTQYNLTRDEARKLARSLICYADLADELDKPENE